MNKNIYKIGFFILLVINVAIIILIVTRPMRGWKHGDIMEKVSKELQLSEQQKTAFIAMAKEHRKQVRAIDDSEVVLVKAYFESINSSDTTINREILMQDILRLKTQKIEATYSHFEDVKAMLNEEQQREFQKFINRVVPMMTGRRGKMLRAR